MIKFIFVNKVSSFIGEVRLELSKVTWPKKEEVIRLTLVVLIISGVVGVYVGALDFGFTKLLGVALSR